MASMRRAQGLRAGLVVLALAWGAVYGAEPPSAPAKPPDPYKDDFVGYKPDFIDQIDKLTGYGMPLGRYRVTAEEMKVSSEPGFFTLSMLPEDARAIALVEAARVREEKGQYREAAKIYQMVIDKFPGVLCRVSDWGVFVPVAQYCQRRLLLLPATDLAYYRALYDGRARDEFLSARSRNSLIGLSELTDSMLATSYGGRAILELGNAAMDSGDHLGALEHFTTIRSYFPVPEFRTPDLNLKMDYCRKRLGREPGAAEPAPASSEMTIEQIDQFRKLVESTPVSRERFEAQRASAPHVTSDDYAPFAPSTDPLGLKGPAWSWQLPGSRGVGFVFTQPVVAGDSVLYRYRNIIYCHSILNGLVRWKCDIGGRASWQNWGERQLPMEDLLVQDGMVITPMHKGGPSLVALDVATGQVRWAYGPMVASSEEEARMRFEAAPAGGLRTVYANYVLDNIEGETHTDTECGVVALDSATGRLRWRAVLGTLAPGQFSTGFAVRRRNKIRSFTSPPLYHEGTVYTTNNAGAIAALDALSGRVKWLSRYPYYPGIHDATRDYGREYEAVSLWFNERPLLVGDRLYVLPVDTRFMFCIDRATGKVLWSRLNGAGRNRYGGLTYGGACCFLGPMSTGELVFVYGIRWESVQLVDPATGKTLWTSPDTILYDDQPVMKYESDVFDGWGAFNINRVHVGLTARPFLGSDDTLCIPAHSWLSFGPYGETHGWLFHLCTLSLRDRKILDHRRFYSGEVLAMAGYYIYTRCPGYIQRLEEIPNPDERLKQLMGRVREVMQDHVPKNQYGPFVPFARLTFERYGVPFELRLGPTVLQMVYDRGAVERAIEKRSDPAADLARAELAIADARYADAADTLRKCLAALPSEDLDLRAMIVQQLYQVHKELARAGIRAARPDDELESVLGMSRTVSTLGEEIEALFALSEAFERKGDLAGAARSLRSIINVYGHREYPVPPVVAADASEFLAAAGRVFDTAGSELGDLYGGELGRPLALLRRGLPLYASAVSPLPKSLTLRAGELAASRLIRLRNASPQFAGSFDAAARTALAAAAHNADEQLGVLREFPGSPESQAALNTLFTRASGVPGVAGRTQLWRLADAARVCGLTVPRDALQLISPPEFAPDTTPIAIPAAARRHDFADPEEMARIALERHGDRVREAALLFLGGRVRKRLDNKFVLTCYDLAAGKVRWEKADIRLKGRGDESGFIRAFVLGDLVVVHGLYDVLAFRISDGELRWRYRVPFDFEIRHAVLSGELLVLAGKAETLALYVPSANPDGDLVWQEKEEGDLYTEPFFIGPMGEPNDRLVAVRKMPFNITVRYRSTGRLIGRLEIPDLTLCERHPVLEGGPEELPVARDGHRLVVSDGWYYIALDVFRLTTLWKRPIDNNDPTTEPAMRFAVRGDYLAVVKNDFDRKSIYMLSSRTGEVLWSTDPQAPTSPQPVFSFFIEGERLCGLAPHPGQGFYFVSMDCKSGRELARREVAGYQARPSVELVPRLFGAQAVAVIQDRQDLELRAFDAASGRTLHVIKDKGVGPVGVPGRSSFTVQNGRLVLLSRDKLNICGAR